jgi:hypothetical protein
MTERQGLYELVAHAARRVDVEREARALYRAVEGANTLLDWTDASSYSRSVCEWVDRVLEFAWRGEFAGARRAADGEAYAGDETWVAAVSTVVDCSWWQDIRRACELADRIDQFLASLAGNRLVAALAGDCRRDLSLLPVLADWCEENGRPTVAAEARHLHRLVRHILR